MTILQIKNNLLDFEKDELIGLIISACKTSSIIKSAFSSQLGDRTDCQKLYCNFQKKLEKSFEPKNSFNISNAANLVNQFENECTSVELIAALMKDFIVNAISFSIDFGDMGESYYAKIASMLKKMSEICVIKQRTAGKTTFRKRRNSRTCGQSRLGTF